MKYVGSKNRLSKELVPIIESYFNEDTKFYLEPFVGGANIIDKIKHNNKIGADSHKELIALLKYAQVNYAALPYEISEEEYHKVKDSYNNKDSQFEDWYYGLVGFCSTFSAKWFGGYARSFKADGVTPRNMSNEAIRNLQKQAPNLKDIKFIHSNFQELDTDILKNGVIYCDPPYQNTTGYGKDFPHDEFWDWVRVLSKDNIVLVSEYKAPSDFEVVWEKGLKSALGSGVNSQGHQDRVEKLFKHKGECK